MSNITLTADLLEDGSYDCAVHGLAPHAVIELRMQDTTRGGDTIEVLEANDQGGAVLHSPNFRDRQYSVHFRILGGSNPPVRRLIYAKSENPNNLVLVEPSTAPKAEVQPEAPATSTPHTSWASNFLSGAEKALGE